MEIKEIKLNGLTIKNNLFFAPLAGFSTAEMRAVVSLIGAGLTFTEMVSAKGLCYDSKATEELLFTYPEEGEVAAQIFGNDPYFIEKACCSKALEKFNIIDINMGCPVPKIFNNGEGSALLKDLSLASKVIKAAVKSGKIITVKTRIGIDDDCLVAKDFAKTCEDSGAKMLTIHGRTKKAVYSGEVNYKQIEIAKKSVSIPVIANGGVFCKKDADDLINKTGADGVMVARGALYNPLIFSEILQVTPPLTLKQAIIKQITLTENRYGSERAGVVLRKQTAYYLKGVENSKKLKEQAFKQANAKTLIDIINSSSL